MNNKSPDTKTKGFKRVRLPLILCLVAVVLVVMYAVIFAGGGAYLAIILQNAVVSLVVNALVPLGLIGAYGTRKPKHARYVLIAGGIVLSVQVLVIVCATEFYGQTVYGVGAFLYNMINWVNGSCLMVNMLDLIIHFDDLLRLLFVGDFAMIGLLFRIVSDCCFVLVPLTAMVTAYDMVHKPYLLYEDCDAPDEETQGDKAPSRKGLWIGLAIAAAFVIYFVADSHMNGTTDYYVDYNNNGRMDKGEYVYSADRRGNEHWDFDGDGWWDN